MDKTLKYLHLEALAAPVSLHVDKAFLQALPPVFAHWPFDLSDSFSEQPFLSINRHKKGYTLTSPFMEAPVTHSSAVNAICAMIVEIAWARLRQDTDLLCLHGAAIEFAERLVVFPSTRRAGKSTLTVALAGAGQKVFTDDFLPLRVGGDGVIEGISSGISPRLRLPVPEQFGDAASAYIDSRPAAKNAQYQYVVPVGPELARFGETAPIGALVFLERTDGQQATLEPVTQDEALKTLITQNFSRALNAAGILQILNAIVAGVRAYVLKYDAVAPAVALLQDSFRTWEGDAPRFTNTSESLFESALEEEFVAPVLDTGTGQFIQMPGVVEVATGDKRFLTGQNGKSIHYLNDGAAMIWRLLEEPTSVEEAIEMLCSVFPEHPAEAIRADVTNTFKTFAENGLLLPAGEICLQEENPVKSSTTTDQDQ